MASNTHELTRDSLAIGERLHVAAALLQDSVEINPNKRGGVPVFKGTRMPISLVLAELADYASISEIAEDLDLSEELIRGFLEGIAIHFDRPFVK